MTAAPRIHLSLAAFPGHTFAAAMDLATKVPPSEVALGALSLDQVQLCPQNDGVLTIELAECLRERYPGTQFRLHANVRVEHRRQIRDWSSWVGDDSYWQTLARVSRSLNSPAYTAHAGRRSESDLPTLIENCRRAQDQFGCPVGIEGHYPTPGNTFNVATWDEYRTVLESGVPYVVDLSHINIVAVRTNRKEPGLLCDLLRNERCIEVHVSDNNGLADQHCRLDRQPWWWSYLAEIHPAATIFSEGKQSAPA